MNKCLNCDKPVKNKYCNVTCQNKHQHINNNNKRFGEISKFRVNCFRCNNEIIVLEREKLFPQKEKYFCSRSCANKKTPSRNTKEKISNSLKKYHNKIKIYEICKQCNFKFEKKKKTQKFCSKSCNTTYRNIHHNLAQKAGLASVNKQNKRSKNEIYFAELCENKFNNIECNKPIFNGWDADVIIHDIKTAVLWNGKWHYEKITKKHSLEQVQNRDRIKLIEIKKYGYNPYIIKDMGRHNKKFVEEQFEEFNKFSSGG